MIQSRWPRRRKRYSIDQLENILTNLHACNNFKMWLETRVCSYHAQILEWNLFLRNEGVFKRMEILFNKKGVVGKDTPVAGTLALQTCMIRDRWNIYPWLIPGCKSLRTECSENPQPHSYTAAPLQLNASGRSRPRVSRILGKGRLGCAKLVWGGRSPAQVCFGMSPTHVHQDKHIDSGKKRSRIHQTSLPGRTHSHTGGCVLGRLFFWSCWMLGWYM